MSPSECSAAGSCQASTVLNHINGSIRPKSQSISASGVPDERTGWRWVLNRINVSECSGEPVWVVVLALAGVQVSGTDAATGTASA